MERTNQSHSEYVCPICRHGLDLIEIVNDSECEKVILNCESCDRLITITMFK